MSPRSFLPSVGLLLAFLSFVLRGQVPGRTTNVFDGLPPAPPQTSYSFADAFPGLTFTQPVAIATPPGETNRLFVVEKTGRIVVVTNLARPNRTVFLNLTTNLLSDGEQGLLGLAFHPRFAENGRFFVFRTMSTGPDGARALHDVVSEFRITATNANAALPSSEIRLFAQFDEASNHNGGDLHFGPDGLLYVSLGDEGGANDNFANGQRIDKELFAGLLRLDVDRRPGSLPPNRDTNNPANAWMITTNYSIPSDNPYVGASRFNGAVVTPSRVRTEFWAVGLRNPWRFSFDSLTGELWIGDVGQDRWEMVYVSRIGANHGWPFREGNVAGPRGGMPSGFLTNPSFNHVPPVYAYAHGSGTFQGNSITGGRVYRGHRISALHGAYIFGDYVSGNIWSLRRNAGAAPTVNRIAGLASVAAFGADPSNGDLLAAQLPNGRISRLVAGGVTNGRAFPATLADTGALVDTASMQVSPAFTAYDVNLPFWSDHAVKSRWFHIPPGTQARFAAKGAWTTPPGTVWLKHFELETTNGVPESRRRVETRFLVRTTNGMYGVTYRWNSPTNAVLVPDEGAEETFQVLDGGRLREQVWRFPSRTECMACHNSAAGGSLSFNTRQLNLVRGYPGGFRTNQLAALASAGFLADLPEALGPLPTFAEPEDATMGPVHPISLEWRVRRYLEVNCAFCHMPGSTGGGFWDARSTTPTDLAGLIRGAVAVDFGDSATRVLAPGDRAHSLLLDRMSRRDSRRMPPIGSNVPDESGVALVGAWIDALPSRHTFTTWLGARLGTNFVAEPNRQADTDRDGDPDYLEFLADTDPADARAVWRPRIDVRDGRPVLRVPLPADTALQVEVLDSLGGAGWRPLDVPANTPGFRSRATEQEIPLPLTLEASFYRVSLSRP
jgi:glucose/arabinose dehydrogenase